MSTAEVDLYSSRELVSQVSQRADVVRAEDFLPLMTVQQAVERKSMVNQFIGQVLKEGEDYGDIPGASKKKVLLKPGAEKLCSIFGLTPSYIKEVIVEDWTGKDHDGEPLFSYEYRCQLYRGGRFMGESIGSCNSWESKYRYRWVSEDHLPPQVSADGLHLLPRRGGQKTMFEPNFAIEKADTTGKYGKPAEYWAAFVEAQQTGAAKRGRKMMGKKEFEGWFLSVDETQYRIPNPDIADVINTCQKMAQKRALVAAVLVVTNCSDAFTQDVEDFEQQEHPTTTRGANAGTDANAGHDSGGTEREISGSPRPARLPEELEALFTPNSPKGSTKTALETCRRELIEAMPQNGEDEYHRILEHNGITRESVANGGAKVRNIATACAQMWTLAQSAKRLKPKEPEPNFGEPSFGVSEDDLGFDPKDDYRK